MKIKIWHFLTPSHYTNNFIWVCWFLGKNLFLILYPWTWRNSITGIAISLIHTVLNWRRPILPIVPNTISFQCKILPPCYNAIAIPTLNQIWKLYSDFFFKSKSIKLRYTLMYCYLVDINWLLEGNRIWNFWR